MSSTALAAVLAKLTGLNFAGKVVVGVAVAAGAASAAGGPAIADHLSDSPETAQVEPTAAPTTPADASTFGQWVAADARDGGVDGKVISAAAHAKNALKHAAKSHPTDLPDASAFGQKVAADARDGGVDGKEISAAAHAKNALKHAAKSHPKDSETTAPGTESKGSDHAAGHGKPTKAPETDE